jgi:hypothetical protein
MADSIRLDPHTTAENYVGAETFLVGGQKGGSMTDIPIPTVESSRTAIDLVSAPETPTAAGYRVLHKLSRPTESDLVSRLHV